MQTIIDTLRDILGVPEFWVRLPGNNSTYSYNWDYGAMIEYGAAVIIIAIVIVSVFKFVRCLIK